MVAWANHVGVSEIARPCRPGQVHGVARDPQERVVQPGGGPDVVLQGEHRPRQEPAQGAAVPPPALVGRSPALGAGGPVDTGPAPAPPGADRGPHHDRAPRPGGRATQPSFRAVHSGLLDHTLGGHKKMSARSRPQEAPQEGPSRRAGQDHDHPRAGRAARHRRPARTGGRGGGRHRRGPYERRCTGHPGAAGPPGGARWAARPPPNARSTSHCSIEQALAPHTVHTLTVDRGHEFAPGSRPSRTTGRPRPLLPGPLPLAARHQ